MNLNAFFNVLMIVVSLVLMATVLLQNRSSGAGSIFGQQTTVFRTRRGLERILYRATIVLGVVFVITAMASVRSHTPVIPPADLNFPGTSLPVQPAPELPVAPSPAPADGTQPSAAPSDAPAPAASPATTP